MAIGSRGFPMFGARCHAHVDYSTTRILRVQSVLIAHSHMNASKQWEHLRTPFANTRSKRSSRRRPYQKPSLKSHVHTRNVVFVGGCLSNIKTKVINMRDGYCLPTSIFPNNASFSNEACLCGCPLRFSIVRSIIEHALRDVLQRGAAARGL